MILKKVSMATCTLRPSRQKPETPITLKLAHKKRPVHCLRVSSQTEGYAIKLESTDQINNIFLFH